MGAIRACRAAAPALAMLLLSLCARATGSVFVGDGLFSGGNSEFDINASACTSRTSRWPPPQLHVQRKRGPERRGEHSAAQENRALWHIY